MSDSPPPTLEYKRPDTPGTEKRAAATPRFALGLALPCLIAATIGAFVNHQMFQKWIGASIAMAFIGAMFFVFVSRARVIYHRNFLVERHGLTTIIAGAFTTCLTILCTLLSKQNFSEPGGVLLFTVTWIAITVASNWVALRPMRNTAR